MNSRDESLPMSPTKTKQFVNIFGETTSSQNDMARSNDFRDDGDLSGDEEDEEEDGEEVEEEEEEEEEKDEEEKEEAISWQKNSNSVGSTLGLLAAIKEEESGDERSPKPKRAERVNLVGNAPMEKLTYGYFDITTSKKQAGVVATPIEEAVEPVTTAADNTEPFGKPLNTERVKTPLAERREQKKDEPLTTPVCLDCIVNGNDHHHGRTPVQSPPPARATFPQPSLASSLKRTSSESIGASVALDSKPEKPITGTPSKSLGHPAVSSFSTPQKSPPEGLAPPTPDATPNTTPSLKRKGTLPAKELTPTRDLHSQGNFSDITPPRDQANLKVAIPTPPKEPQPGPSHERSSPTKKLFNPGTPARQRVPAIPPTPPSTPARRKSLPHEFSKSYLNLPTPVEEEPSSSIEPAQTQIQTKEESQEQPQTETQTEAQTKSQTGAQAQTENHTETETQTVSDIRKGRGHSRSHSESHSHNHSHSHGDGDDDNCPFVSRHRSFRELHQTKSYSNKPNGPDSVRRLTHSYSTSDINSQRRSSSLPRNPDQSYLGMPNGYSRSTSPEFSRMPYIQRPGSTDGYRRPGSSDGFRRPGSSDGFRRLGSADDFRRPGSSDGSRLGYNYMQSRPTTPDVGYGGSRIPFIEGSESGSWAPHPPPPSIASSVGTSANSSMLLNPLAPAIAFRREAAPRSVSHSMISENDFNNLDRFFEALRKKGRSSNQTEEPDSPVDELTSESKVGTVVPDIPKIEVIEENDADSKEGELVQNILPRISKFYLQYKNILNLTLSIWLFFLLLGTFIGVATGFTYCFGDSGITAFLFGPGRLFEDLSPLIAICVWMSIFLWITVTTNRIFSPEAEELQKQGLLAEIIGSKRATTLKRRLTHPWAKTVMLFVLIGAGTRGLYVGGQIVMPPLAAGVNKGVSVGMRYFDNLRTPTTEIATGTETEIDAAKQDPWADMDFMYFQSSEDMDAKQASSMEGGQGEYSPGADGGYFGDEREISWGEVFKMGITIFAPPMGVGALAWRRGRSQ